ncbi:hypothetical protein VN0561_14790 [Helicobacter pylori]
MRNFPIHHNGFKHEVLARMLKRHKGPFILSYNDCEFVRNAYKDFKILEPSWQYTMDKARSEWVKIAYKEAIITMSNNLMSY